MRIILEELTKRYGGFEALKDLSLEIKPGQIVALLGPNGAGKTTLLRCLAGIAAADRGRILYDGEPFRRDRIELRRRLFFLPDFPVCLPEKTVIGHIGMSLRLYGADVDGVEERVVQILKDFDLLPMAEMPVGLLSRGQAYKAGLAALLAVDPELWLIDEPFASGMDPFGIQAFKEHARGAAGRVRTILYTTQILDVAERFSDRVCILHEGAVYAFDSVANMKERSTSGALEEVFRRLREERG
jgi:ABC-type multidrug transport system ATPase subunit